MDGETIYNMTLPFGKLDLVGNINKFFKGDGAFLDWYIAALITGSILGMNRKLLLKAAARYFPAIFGGLILAFGLCMGVAAIMGYPVMNALLLIALPIMGGGMGAGATPLSKIFETSSSMSAAEALSVMTPAVAIGNAVSIVLAGILVKILKGKLNGNGALMQAGSIDPKELEISPEMQDFGCVLRVGLYSGRSMESAWHRNHNSCLCLDDYQCCDLQDHEHRARTD